ncbi:MAG: UvrB/UvrC motif-containing protein [Planctomycetaceae bacterium]|nr:UvrB/UvrC motif-containing protein [Planctomycetales bacterium]MCB9924720.1 UvrB/UvrC motif-containing protein [Planctomycetaceae bacterium]
MSHPENLDDLLRDWSYEPQTLGVRIVAGSDGRDVLQMRIDMGVLQLEMEGRPDGTRPNGFDSYYDYLVSESIRFGDEFVIDDDQANEVDREFVQYYHRRICWLRLQDYERAIRDADHTLALMDFCKKYSDDDQWTLSHEQYRPFVLFHRTQAAALALLDEGGPEESIKAINSGLERLRDVFEEYEAEDHFDDDELVSRLLDLRETLRKEYEVGKTLDEQLADAVAKEQYELAARLRDELARREV